MMKEYRTIHEVSGPLMNNLQAAFSTGHLAALSAVKELS